MFASVRTADESTVRVLDGAVLAWVVLWFVVAGLLSWTVWGLADLGDSVTQSGGALETAGRALADLGGVPVIGERPAELGRETVETGQDLVGRGQEVKGEMRRLSVLLGLAVAFMPTTPVVGLFLPLRAARRREKVRLARSLRDHAGPGLDRYLAERATRNLPYDVVARVEPDPWDALEEGRTRGLADAELARLGLRRPSGT